MQVSTHVSRKARQSNQLSVEKSLAVALIELAYEASRERACYCCLRPILVHRHLVLPLSNREGVDDAFDGVSWGGKLADGQRSVTGPFFVGAEGETEEGGVEFAAELEAAFLAPPVRGPSISAVPGERLNIPAVYGSPRICG